MAAVLRVSRFLPGRFCKHVAFAVSKCNESVVYVVSARRRAVLDVKVVPRRLP